MGVLKLKYLYDERGNKTDVVVPVRKFEQMMEDLSDLKAIEDRKNEKAISFEDFKKDLKRNGKILTFY